MKAPKTLHVLFPVVAVLAFPVYGKEDPQGPFGHNNRRADTKLMPNELKSISVDTQSTRGLSEEYGEWADCSGTDGLCINTSVYTCSVDTLFNFCPGGKNIRCCPAPAGAMSDTCFSDGIGLCGRTVDCSTSAIGDKCPGPAEVTCCPTEEESICASGTKLCGHSDCCSSWENCTSVSMTWVCVEIG